MNNEQKRLVIEELTGNINAYLKAMRKYGPQAAEKLNVKISQLADIIETLKKEI